MGDGQAGGCRGRCRRGVSRGGWWVVGAETETDGLPLRSGIQSAAPAVQQEAHLSSTKPAEKPSTGLLVSSAGRHSGEGGGGSASSASWRAGGQSRGRAHGRRALMAPAAPSQLPQSPWAGLAAWQQSTESNQQSPWLQWLPERGGVQPALSLATRAPTGRRTFELPPQQQRGLVCHSVECAGRRQHACAVAGRVGRWCRVLNKCPWVQTSCTLVLTCCLSARLRHHAAELTTLWSTIGRLDSALLIDAGCWQAAITPLVAPPNSLGSF